MLSSLEDLLKFAEALLGSKHLSPRSQDLIMTAGDTANSQAIGQQQQHIMQVENTEFRVVKHKSGGGRGGVTAELSFHPESGTPFVGFTNSFGHFTGADYSLKEVLG